VRLTFAILLALVSSGIAYGQAGNDPGQVVKQIIDTGLIQGWDRKVIFHLGDAGAVLVTKVLADRDLTSKTIGGALMVIEDSFADPRFVEAAADREPRAALLVLRYLDLSTNDAELKRHVVDTRKYIQDRYAVSQQATKQ
jgi:hypothetical protein